MSLNDNNIELTNSNGLPSTRPIDSSCEIKVICLNNNLPNSRSPSPSRFKVDKVSSADCYDSSTTGSTVNSNQTANGNANCNHNNNTNHVNKRGSMDDNSIYETKTSHLTREAAPRVDHYRNMASVHGHISRPTLDELHGYDFETSEGSQQPNLNYDKYQQRAVKLGWITGVLVRCLSGIWGIMLFLRMGWVVAHAGIGLGSVIVLLSSLVSTVTSLSMSAICTNGEVKGGGTYYMISRSLGPEFGGSIGVIFSLANAVAAAMYTIGFSEAINSILKVYNSQITVSDLDNMRIIGCITLFILIIIIFIGTGWESKVQVGLVVILIVSIFNFVFGSLRSPSSYAIEKGFTGWKVSNLEDNFGPEFRNGETFFSIFSVYFPAATGFLAGANISGDLKDPQRAIPLGTLTAIAITTASYLLFIIIFGGTSVREVIALNGTSLLIDGEKQGLYYNYNLILLISFYGPLIYCGIFAAAISSALGSLVSAPKVFQALCQDKIFPYLSFFGHGSGPNDSPYRGYILGFIIALACCLIADLNSIAPIISNFFLAAYCLINFSCFHASFSKTLGFRPSFRYYNLWVSLVGSIVCLIIMFIMNWPTALLTFVIEFILYMLVQFRKPDVNWGSSTRAQIYKSALSSAHKLYCMPDHTKTYRPQILLLSGDTFVRPSLVDFAYSIVQGIGLMVCCNITQDKLHQKERESLQKRNNHWLRDRGIKAFYSIIDEESFGSGAKSLIQATGIGKLRPNIVFMGYKNDWQTCDIESFQDYFNVIHQTLDKHLSLCILRVFKGFDCSNYGQLTRVFEILEDKQSNAYTNKSFNLTQGINKTLNKLRNGNSYSPSDSPTSRPPEIVIHQIDIEDLANQSANNNDPIPDEIIQNIDLFRKKSVKSTIDVWWLYDDGGLTMLIPYILSSKKQWSDCRLRIFTIADKIDDLNSEQRNMASLLSKFRIDYSDIIVIPDISKPPKEENKNKFKALIGKWRIKDDQEIINGSSTFSSSPASSSSPSPIPPDISSPTPPPHPQSISPYITDAEWNSQKRKSYRQIRIRELIEKYSTNSNLIVMTLPIPRKGSCSASLFMAWLETLTVDMPPFLLVRGSQQSVLTFYS